MQFLKNVSCCLITKDDVYPKEILEYIQTLPFGEILILTHSDSPYRKHELFKKSKYDLIYYQDDDAICPIEDLIKNFQPDTINVLMKHGHFEVYKNNRATMGLGWGCIFPKSILTSLNKYKEVYGEDDIFKRETERILTYLNFPQNRIISTIVDLPSAYNVDRLWKQSNHNQYKEIAEKRCAGLT